MSAVCPVPAIGYARALAVQTLFEVFRYSRRFLFSNSLQYTAMRALALGTAALFLLTSCNSLEEGGSESKVLAETDWKLVSIKSDRVETTTAGKEPYRLFFDSESEFSGVSDCNDIFGQYSASGEDEQVEISDMGSSLVRCSPESLNEEFVRLLGSASTFEIENGQLTIASDEGTLVFDRVSRNEYAE